jgi:hypothetical protein
MRAPKHRRPPRFTPGDYVAWGAMLAVLAVLLPVFWMQLRATGMLP